MNALDKLERRFGRLALPRVTLYLVVGQVLFYVLGAFDPGLLPLLELEGAQVLRGEVWRLVTFLFVPPLAHPIFAFFAWYLFYLMGSALEHQWGAFRYNAFLLIAWAATLAVAFAMPAHPTGNAYIGGSVFLAFAWLYPDFELYLFFVLPVKIRWLALVTWIWYGIRVLTGSWTERLLVLASILNILVFFGREMLARARAGRRRMHTQAAAVTRRAEPRHRCAACGIDNLSHPDTDFRYCTACKPARAYCPAHLRAHTHVRDTEPAPPPPPTPAEPKEDLRSARDNGENRLRDFK